MATKKKAAKKPAPKKALAKKSVSKPKPKPVKKNGPIPPDNGGGIGSVPPDPTRRKRS